MIFFFIKMFSRKEFADAFLDGHVYFRKLSYFKGVEEEESATRGDRFEGTTGWHQPGQVKVNVSFGNKSFDIGKLAAPLHVQATMLDHVHVFCLYAAHHSHLVDVEKSGDDVIKGKLRVPTELLNFGEHAVLVEPDPFIKRMRASIQEKKYRREAGLVEYYDPDTFSGEFSIRDALFRKRNEFAYQSEYRFAFLSEIIVPDAVTLEAASLRDICRVLTGDNIRGGVTMEINV